jgi:hypothetical protein
MKDQSAVITKTVAALAECFDKQKSHDSDMEALIVGHGLALLERFLLDIHEIAQSSEAMVVGKKLHDKSPKDVDTSLNAS